MAKLKTNYKSYELKRKLSDSYDLFLADKRLYHKLPHLLGKKFFEKKKCVLISKQLQCFFIVLPFSYSYICSSSLGVLCR